MDVAPWAVYLVFRTPKVSWINRHRLNNLLSSWTETWDDQKLMNHLQRHGVIAGAVLTAQDLVADPHLEARGYIEEFQNVNAPQIGVRKYAGRPFRTPGMPFNIRNVASLGEHNVETLKDIAGLSQEEIATLADDGIISTQPLPTETRP